MFEYNVTKVTVAKGANEDPPTCPVCIGHRAWFSDGRTSRYGKTKCPYCTVPVNTEAPDHTYWQALGQS